MDTPLLVLCVTNNAGRGVIENLSEHDEFETVVETRGRDATERIDRDVDCVLSRLDLPDMDGLELLRTVREMYPDLPFVLFTDQGSESVASDAISAGVTEYVQESRVSDSSESLAETIESVVDTVHPGRESHRRLEELAESTTDCLWIFSRDWSELFFISGYEEVWGRPVERIKENPQDFIKGVHPEDRDSVERAMTGLSNGESVNFEFRVLRGNHETGWVWVKGEPVFDDTGNVVRVVGFTRDVSARKERERQFETLIENLPGVVYRAELNPGWPMKFVHGECEELTGYTPEELRHEISFGKDVIYHRDRDDVFESIRRAVDDQESFELTYRITTKDGEIRWIWERGREVDDGVVEGFLTDITARVTHKQELELRNQAIREAPVGVVITDPKQAENPIVYANDKFMEMTGYPETEVLGRNCRFLQGPETRDEQIRAMREAIEQREPMTVELRNYRRDGSMFWNRVSIAPVRNDDGTVVNFIGFQEDVTERKERQEQLKVLSRVLRHNLRNNQNAIRSWAEVLESRGDPDLREFAERIIEKSDQLMTVADKEREITEILTEKPRRHVIDVTRVLQQCVNAARAEFSDAEFTLECPEGTTIVAVHRIEGAIAELLTNAVVHNDSATPNVSVTVTQRADAVEICIADNGNPIPEMEYPGLLYDKEESPVYHHGGLGLWFVNLVVSRSEGTLSFGENQPRGNVVRISVPVEE